MFKPHLACDAKLDQLTFPLYVQYKIDGVRGMVQDDKCTGRSLKPFKNKKLVEYFSRPCFNGFDFEIGATKPNDPDLCRLTTSLTGTINGELPAFIIVFDYLTPETIDLPFKERMEVLEAYIQHGFGQSPDVAIYVSPQYKMNSLEELMAFYESALEQHYEGLVIRKQDGNHKNNRCTVTEGNYLRLKPTKDAEGEFLRVEEAYENQNEATINELGHTERSSHKENKVPKGMIGAIWIKDLKSGQEIKIGAGKMTHEERKYYFEHQEELHSYLIKYKFLGTGKKDKPRHARFHSFRDKVDMSN